ncbi:MAG: fatty acid desaturase [Chitinophagaceae bacterium]|nr:MAG: fatty acid desaturase [Chitinophagaceae bacterium]
MKSLTQITDPVFIPSENKSKTDRLFISLINDERDLPFVYLTIYISLSLVPLGILLYMPFVGGWLWWVVAAAYQYFNNFVFKGPFGLMLHCTSHRKLYKDEYSFLNKYLPWVVGPFFGQTPETYFTHHIGMHHPENNLPEDRSTTMPYQRDSFKGFLHYFGDFFFLGIPRLIGYFMKKNRRKLMIQLIKGELIFIAACVLLSFYNWPATLVVFIIPFLISRIIMMLGNWAQHAFIDGNDPGNAYKNSITCINTKYNHKCWNDGYHISHHIRPAMYWTEHPVFFQKTLQKYIDNKAIVFDGIHFLHVSIWLMAGRYDLLAKNFVNLGDQYSSDEEIIAFLKSRTKKINVQVGVPIPVAVRAA